jgi:hypothetical protein
MPIVQHCTSFSYSLLPPYPLLAPPPTRLALTAPKISGLLTAPKLTVVVEHYDPMDEFIEKYGPFRSAEEMDEELYAEMKSPVTRAIYAEIVAYNKARREWDV